MFVRSILRVCKEFFSIFMENSCVFVGSFFRVSKSSFCICEGFFSCSEKLYFGFISNFLVFI